MADGAFGGQKKRHLCFGGLFFGRLLPEKSWKQRVKTDTKMQKKRSHDDQIKPCTICCVLTVKGNAGKRNYDEKSTSFGPDALRGNRNRSRSPGAIFNGTTPCGRRKRPLRDHSTGRFDRSLHCYLYDLCGESVGAGTKSGQN